MTHKTKNSLSRQYRPGDSWLDDLFLEVSCQRSGMAVDELRKKRVIAQVMQMVDSQPPPPSKKRERTRQTVFRRRIVAGVAAAAAVVFAMFALLSQSTGIEVSQNVPVKQMADVPRARHTIAAPPPAELLIEKNTRLKSLENVSTVHLSAGIELGIGLDTKYAVGPIQKNRVVVSLVSGTLWISKDPGYKSTPLHIDTPHGDVEVTGTALTVFVGNDVSIVRVFDGEVRVIDNAHVAHILKAENMLTASEQMTKTEQNPNLAVERKQFDVLGLPVTHSRRDAGKTRRAARAQENGSAAELKQKREPEAATAEIPTLDELYTEILKRRNEKNWRAAVDGYHQLIALYGNTGKSHAAKVAVANLYLEKLNQPELAMQWYDSYLMGRSKTLAPEALLGKANALRALNRPNSEKQILKQIVQQYPDSLYGVQAKQRLSER